MAEFQPALPLRGVTDFSDLYRHLLRISTRTPLTGSDKQYNEWLVYKIISTRTPLTGSDAAFSFGLMTFVKFQPALPLRGVTRTA